MKNGSNSRSKKSKIAISTNSYIIAMMIFQLVLSLAAAIYTTFWSKINGEKAWYLKTETGNIAAQIGS
jgi:hypothetical protein